MKVKSVIKRALCIVPIIKDWFAFRDSMYFKVFFKDFLRFKIRKKGVYWPLHKNSEVTHPLKIYVGVNTCPGFRPGCYISGLGGIIFGDRVEIASNVGVISANHQTTNFLLHTNPENPIKIGNDCWIGQNSVILPEVELGPHTIVGAGSVVTKSFPEGYCVIGGNPAKLIKHLDKEKCVSTSRSREYVGFIAREEFMQFAEKYMPNHKYIDLIRENYK